MLGSGSGKEKSLYLNKLQGLDCFGFGGGYFFFLYLSKYLHSSFITSINQPIKMRSRY